MKEGENEETLSQNLSARYSTQSKVGDAHLTDTAQY